MNNRPVPLDSRALRAELLAPGGPLGRLEIVPATGSTNADLLAQAEEWPDLGVLVADNQSAGRGRLDRVWTAPAGSSLIASVMLRPASASGPLPPAALGWLSLLSAVALAGVLQTEGQLDARLKWPNDVLVNGAKISGILAQLVPARDSRQGAPEQDSGPAVVLGTGLNVTQARGELPVRTATSLALEGSATLDRNVLLVSYLRSFAGLYREFCFAGGHPTAPLSGAASLMQRATAALGTLGSLVRADLPGGATVEGLAVGLDNAGCLLITDRLGTTHTVSAGDIVHLRAAGPAGGYA